MAFIISIMAFILSFFPIPLHSCFLPYIHCYYYFLHRDFAARTGSAVHKGFGFAAYKGSVAYMDFAAAYKDSADACIGLAAHKGVADMDFADHKGSEVDKG